MASSWLWPLLLAPFVGSFLGVLITRLPAQLPVVLGRSACSHCGARLGAADLVPLISFLILRGRCRYCRSRIDFIHPAIEVAAVAVALWAELASADLRQVWIGCGLGWTLLTLAWIDWTEFLLPDVLTLPLLLAGLTVTLLWDRDDLIDHCIATVVAYGSFYGLAIVYRAVRGKEGLGGGDAKLMAAAGAWCGLSALPVLLLVSAMVGLLAALGLLLTGKTVTSATRIPFGSCIALAFWFMWLHGSWVDDLVLMLGRF